MSLARAASWILVLAAWSCGRPAPGPPLNVVLVTIDTLRADRLGTHGCPMPTSPNIDALAADAVVFENALATAPATGPSLASLLTGTYGSSHGVARNNLTRVFTGTTLAEILRGHGYRTMARNANPVADTFARRFDDSAMPPDLVEVVAGKQRGARVVQAAERLLDSPVGEPFFLWLHVMDPHGPYLPPAGYRSTFDPAAYRLAGDEDLLVSKNNYGRHVLPRYQIVDAERAPAEYRARYDGEIRYADEQVGAIVTALRTRGLWGRTVLILSADHGESLGEHDYYFQHGQSVTDDLLHVPLIISAPGLPRGRRIAATVSLIDVVATVLDLVGRRLPAGVEGRSLVPVIDGQEGDRPAWAESHQGEEAVALRRGRLKYIARAGSLGGGRLYDVVQDPGETTDLAAARPAEAAALDGELRAWMEVDQSRKRRHTEVLAAQLLQGRSQPAPTVPDQDRRQRLRALGYAD